jgi:hypothetical protein
MCIQIKYNISKPFLVMFVYRPPDSSQWIDTFEQLLDKNDRLNLETYILDALNFNYVPGKKSSQLTNIDDMALALITKRYSAEVKLVNLHMLFINEDFFSIINQRICNRYRVK